MTTKAAIYVRISDDKTGEHLGVARQEADCRELAQRRGLEVLHVYCDNDVSAFSGKHRPAYEALLDEVQRGQVDTVLVYMTSRLWRDRRERAAGSDLFMRLGVRVLPVRGPELDFSSAAGRLVANILGEMDTHESAVKSERQQRKAQELAQAGKVSGGGDRPFGYEEDRLTVRESEAEIVRDLARRCLAGESIRGLANDLNERGIPTSRGGQWSSFTMRRVLMSARIAGQREHHGDVVADAVWPGLISKEESARLRALLGDPGRLKANRMAPRYLLTGLLRCSRCGKGLVGRRREDGAPRYVCNKTPGSGACGGTYVIAASVEEYLIQQALEVLDTPALRQALLGAEEGTDNESLYEQLRGVEDDLDALAKDMGAGRITRREWMLAREGLQRQADDLNRLLSVDRRSALLNADEVRAGLRAAWPSLSRDRRRAYLDLVFDSVVVGPGRRGFNGFDADRFDVVWRA